jgi:hypothetical protein
MSLEAPVNLVRTHMRTILKHLKSLPSSSTPAGISTYKRIKEQFHSGKNITDANLISRLRENASCYSLLISSINELKHLRALDTGDKLKPRDHINATAARVGFSMPK